MIAHPPSQTGGRRMRVDGQILGLAFNLADPVKFLRRADLEGLDEVAVARSELIEWRGRGSEHWPS
ncbi:hypothetical protein [Streptomyces chryseus]